MSLFTLIKITRTRYYLGGKEVSPGTPGAEKVTERSPFWYAYRRHNGRQEKVKLYTDKAASQKRLAELNTRAERGEVEMTDPRKKHLDRPAKEHLDEFLPVMRASGKSKKDKDRKEGILKAFVATLGPLRDLTADSVSRYVSAVPGSAGNKKKHLSAVSVFVTWLLDNDRIATSPITRVKVPSSGVKSKRRRALTPEQLQKLLDAARTRPLRAFADRYGAEIREDVRKALETRGRERALVYKTAVYTALRLGEIAALRPCYLQLDCKPYPKLVLPGALTKNGKEAKLLLVPAFAAELNAWVEGMKKGADDPLFHVPQASARIMRADLKFAGVPYRTALGDADFHSLRMTSNVMLGRAGIPARIRQMIMRHSDIRLTMATYDDEAFLDLEAAVKAMEGLGLT
jgi:integrase